MRTAIGKVGPCGTCCSQCIAAKDDPATIEMLTEKGFPREALPCKGCREIDGHCPSPSLGGKQCGIFRCAEKQNYSFCFECAKAPCDRLMPIENPGNYRYHNMKCFNLLYIQKHGVDNFVEQAERIQKMYFTTTLTVVGESPQ
jgi:hypothetical protein